MYGCDKKNVIVFPTIVFIYFCSFIQNEAVFEPIKVEDRFDADEQTEFS